MASSSLVIIWLVPCVTLGY